MSFRRSVSISLIGLLGAAAHAAEPARPAPTDLSGEWQLTTVYFGEPVHERLTLKAEKGKLSGSVRGGQTPVTGRVDGDRVRFEWKQKDGEVHAYDGRLESGAMSGTVTLSNQSWGETPPSPWRAVRPAPESGKPSSPRTLDFEPKEFHRVFSATIAPALTIWPGDIVRTRTVDAAGVDEKGKSRVLGGNPQTGPFYVEGAMPGDTIAVHIRRLRLNRPTAVSDDAFVGRAITNDYAGEHKDMAFNDVVWHLDVEKGVARLAKPTEHLKHLEVPVRPMLGCVGVAPGFGSAAIRTGDSGRIGGNMDFNEIGEGATVYLAVSQPGALLYLGDAHALQGDGELNGNALETSADVEFSVDLLREKGIGAPRVENATHIMAMGLAGSLDDAFRQATSSLASWLEKDYGLTGPEAAMLLGATVEYKVSEVADRNVGIVAKIAKTYLPPPAKR